VTFSFYRVHYASFPYSDGVSEDLVALPRRPINFLCPRTATQLDCNSAVNYNAGCGVQVNSDVSYGPSFNNNGGGWFVFCPVGLQNGSTDASGVHLLGMQWRGQTPISISGSGPGTMDRSPLTLQTEAGSLTQITGSATVASLI